MLLSDGKLVKIHDATPTKAEAAQLLRVMSAMPKDCRVVVKTNTAFWGRLVKAYTLVE